jgi:hypothetical protein
MSDDLAEHTSDLTAFLSVLMPVEEVPATIQNIGNIHSWLKSDKHLSQTLLEELIKIRGLALSTSSHTHKLQCTGNFRLARCMCLFVCGLLKHDSMSFLQLSQDNGVYAVSFCSYMIHNLERTIPVVQSSPDTNNEIFGYLVTQEDFTAKIATPSTQIISGQHFICAREKSEKNMKHTAILVLDAFSETGQFVQYHPVV